MIMYLIDKLQTTLDKAFKGYRYVPDGQKYSVPLLWKEDLVGDSEDFSIWVKHHLAEEYDLESTLMLCELEGTKQVVVSCEGYILSNVDKSVIFEEHWGGRKILEGKSSGLWLECPY